MTDSARIRHIHSSVRGRTTALARVNGIRTAATAALEALETFLKKPTREHLHAFEVKERAWAEFATRQTKSFAREIRGLMKAGPIVWQPSSINSNYNRDFNPYCGFVYGMWSIQRPYKVKLGITTRHPMERMNELKKSHQLDHLEILFFFEVGRPRDVEHELHKRVGTYIEVNHKHDSREWFLFDPPYALAAVLGVIEHLKVKRYPTKYVHKRIGPWPEIHHWPSGPESRGAFAGQTPAAKRKE